MTERLYVLSTLQRGTAVDGLNSVQAFVEQLHSMPNDNFTIPLVACFDESGKLADSKVVAFAGCVGYPSAWADLASAWIKRLSDDGLSRTSMKEALHFKGQFSSWNKDVKRRDALLTDLAGLIHNAPLVRAFSVMTTGEFKALPERDKLRLGGDLHYVGFESCVRGILNEDPSMRLHIACDLSEEYSVKILKLFHKLRLRSDLPKGHLLRFA